ncbi:MAG TPA: hypothetical protein VL752_11225 [Acidisoma sp.]|uniref:hypothetical protein n=1 Tax=Acidisoma sp. TaxID=1872115 RepID=UPI002CA0CA40|nr:hypothetical protein [Acidisoma sp.]HTI01507.1 hypothetical protein [Acidisoma sp.]
MRKMTPSLSSSPPETIEDCRTAGETLGQEMRGRSRTKFETVLTQRLDRMAEQIAGSALDAEEAIAAFDVAAWDAWEAVLSGAAVSEAAKSEGGRNPGRNKSAN